MQTLQIEFSRGYNAVENTALDAIPGCIGTAAIPEYTIIRSTNVAEHMTHWPRYQGSLDGYESWHTTLQRYQVIHCYRMHYSIRSTGIHRGAHHTRIRQDNSGGRNTCREHLSFRQSAYCPRQGRAVLADHMVHTPTRTARGAPAPRLSAEPRPCDAPSKTLERESGGH